MRPSVSQLVLLTSMAPVPPGMVSWSAVSRFEMRLTPSQKERLDRAAEFRGLSTSQWALTNLLVAADRDIRESHVLHLDDEAWDSFVRALDEPMPEEMVRLLESEPIWK